MAEKVEYDLAELLKGSVPTIEPKLSGLSNEELLALTQLERAGSARSTLLKAIEAEQIGRNEAQEAAMAAETPVDAISISGAITGERSGNDAASAPSPDAADTADGTFADAPLPDPAVNDLTEEQRSSFTFSRGALLTALADIGVVVGLGEDIWLVAASAIRSLHSELNVPGDVPVLAPALPELVLSGEADAATAMRVLFEGAGGRPIETLGAMAFEPDDFVHDASGKSRVLARPIVFPQGIGADEVCAVWLIDADGEPWSRCTIIGRLPVGGGRSASIPAHYLRFDVPAAVPLAA